MLGGTAVVFRRKGAALLVAAAMVALLSATASSAQESGGLVPADLLQGGSPALISADELSYDETLGIATARGRVEISQGERVLFADVVSYNQRTNVVTASGNIALVEPDGNVVYSSYLELTDDLREGFVRDIRILLTDDSRIAAADGVRTGGNRTTMRRAVYSPCELCEEDPTRAPLWQIKAEEVQHDQEEKIIKYNNAWLEFWGVPVLYTPYFSHPDPTVDRKSGFLTPTLRRDEQLGFQYQQAYYWNIAPNQDLTITPRLTTKQNAQVMLDYRLLQPDSSLDAVVSGTIADRETNAGNTKENVFRGHVDIQGNWDIDETWRAGIVANRSTDDTYLRVYDLGNEPRLTSTAFAEGFRQRNYASIQAFTYQALRSTEDTDEQAIVAPIASYNFVSEPGRRGDIVRVDGSLMNLFRTDGRDSRRASLMAGWELPYTGPAGDVYKLSVSLQGDAYWTDDVDKTNNLQNPANGAGSDFAGRVFPRVALQYRYPLISQHETFYQTLEPVVQFVAAPDWGNSGKIPNEDSQDFELDDLNLFSLNRFGGVDRVSPGTRVDYGLKWSAAGNSGGYVEAFVGQSYRFDNSSNDNLYTSRSGVDSHLSDIVTRLYVNPFEWLEVGYRGRFDKDNLEARRQETDLRIGPKSLNVEATYSYLDGGIQPEFPNDRQELLVRLNTQVTPYWSAFVQHREDLENNRSLATAGGITYSDECFLISGVIEKTKYDDREIDPETRFILSLSLKHLGDVAIE